VAAGVNVTLIWQFAPAETAPLQVLVCGKSPALAPVTAIPEIASAALPELVSVTACAVSILWKVRIPLAQGWEAQLPRPSQEDVRDTRDFSRDSSSTILSGNIKTVEAPGTVEFADLEVACDPLRSENEQSLRGAQLDGAVPAGGVGELVESGF